MADQAEGIIRDSDIKFHCRLMLFALAELDNEDLNKLFLPEIKEIVRLENERLDKLKRAKKIE